VKLASTPRTIGLFEQGVLANRLLIDLRSRLADATDPFETAVLRLNIGVALARLGDWAAAAEEWQRVKLPETSAVGEGTVHYLLGLAAENLGRRADAEVAFKAAASSESLLSEDGPAVRDLAEAKLAELSRPAR
jgi:tetratricopeptide (TPR) repeat protein